MTVLRDLTWQDLDGRDRRVLVVPVGSLEQHGPHLPLDTDAFLATAVAERSLAERPGAGLAPTIPFGASGEHAGFPGTLSIGTATLRDVVVELVRDASRDWGGVLVVNGHGGNARALADAASRCAHEGRVVVVEHLAVPGADAHAGRTETSMMLHLDPGRVRLELAEAGVTAPLAQLLPDLVRGGVRSVSPNGVLGDARGASAIEGRSVVERLVGAVVRAHDRCLELVRETGGG